MNRKIKRLLSVLLCLALCVSLLPAAVFATEDEPLDPPAEAEVTETPAEPEVTDPPAEPEVAETPDDPEPTETPDEPEPTETPDDPEPTEVPVEPEPTETPDAEERAEITAVRVYFICTPEAAVVRVWAAPAEGGEPDESAVIAPGADGAYLLAPGAYLYTVSCEGFASVELRPLAVEAREDALNVEIALEALAAEGESGEEIASAEAQNSIVLSGSCGENVSFTLDDEGLLTISGTGAMENYQYEESSPGYSKRSSVKTAVIESGVTSVGERAFQDCGLTSVTIPASVTSIGDYAFQGCGDLTSIALPAVVTSIGDFAFYNCTNLTSVTIPEGVTSIGSYAFCDCSNLTSITIPEGVTSIGDWAFGGCENLMSVTLPEGVTSIGSSVFYECAKLASIVIPGSVTSIGYQAFMGCGALESVTLPEGVTDIGDRAFMGCGALENVTIPASLKTVGAAAFLDCEKLKNVHISDLGAWCAIRYSDTWPSMPMAEGGELYLNGSKLTAAVIPEGVTSIGGFCFYNCKSITSVSIPESVTSIGRFAFYSCSSLVRITIPESVTSIGESAFENCSSLTRVTLPQGLDKIEENLFSGCSALARAEIPAGVTSIGDGAFERCGLTSVTIPEGVTSIGDGAFSGCGLTSVTIPAGVTSIGACAFYRCSDLTSITIPASLKTVGSEAFYRWWSANGWNEKPIDVYVEDLAAWLAVSFDGSDANPLNGGAVLHLNGERVSELVIPAGATSIGAFCFAGCSSITSVTIPEGVTSIGNRAFAWCRNLTSATIPEGVTSISDGTFQSCNALASVTIPDGVTSIGTYAFYNTAPQKISIPASVNYIGAYAFEDCGNLNYIELRHEAGAELAIGACAFLAPSETATAICVPDPENVHEELREYDWESSKRSVRYYPLGTVLLPDQTLGGVIYSYSMEADGYVAVGHTDALPARLAIPAEIGGYPVKGIGDKAFRGCNNLTSVTIPEGVTSVGDFSFWGCSGMTSIVFPESLRRIGSDSFCYTGLTSVTIPGGVTDFGEIGENFCNSALESVTICEGITALGKEMFSGCDSLTSVSLPQSLRSMGRITFRDCTALTAITIPDGVTSIGGYCFYGCSALKSITIPAGVTSMGEAVFSDCSSLASITIAEGVTSIGDEAFTGCSNLTSITLPSTVTSIGNGAFGYCSNLASITMPEGVTSIGRNAFWGCGKLTSITIPEGVTSISYGAFSGCGKLASITIPEGVTSVGESAFYMCTALEDVYFDGTQEQWDAVEIGGSNDPLLTAEIHFAAAAPHRVVVSDVGTDAGETIWTLYDDGELVIEGTGVFALPSGSFMNYELDGGVSLLHLIRSVVVCEGITGLEASFNECHDIRSFSFPASLNSIGERVFGSCLTATVFTVAEGNTSFRVIDGALYQIDPMELILYPRMNGEESFSIPAGVTGIRAFAFEYNQSLRHLTIPDSVTSIGCGAFAYTKLEELALPEGITNLDGTACSLSGIRRLILPASMEYFPFSDMYALECVEVAKGNPRFTSRDGVLYSKDMSTLLYCPSGKTGCLVIPEGVTVIDRWAFSGSGNCLLRRIEIPRSMTDVPADAFAYCRNLENLVIADGCTAFLVSDGAIYTNDGSMLIRFLKDKTGEAVFPEGTKNISPSMLLGCSGITGVSIPASVTYVDPDSFADCSALQSFTVAEGNTDFCVIDGLLCNSDGSIVACPTGLSGTVTIPNGIVSIGHYAFRNCRRVTGFAVAEGNSEFCAIDGLLYSGDGGILLLVPPGRKGTLVIPEGTVRIGGSAFDSDPGLTALMLPASLESCDGLAYGDLMLEQISVSESNASFSSEGGVLFSKDGKKLLAFPRGRTGSYTIPRGVKEISDGAMYANNLTELVIPRSVKRIVRFALMNSRLTDVWYCGTAEEWSAIEIAPDNWCLFDATIHFASADAPAFASHSLLLSGEIGVNFYMDLSGLTRAEKSGSCMRFLVNGVEQTDAYDASHTNPGGDGWYGFTCFISSVQMADTITAIFCYGDGGMCTQTYRVMDYINYVNQNPAFYSDSVRSLAAALRGYGASVQPFLASCNGWIPGVEHAAMGGGTSFDADELDAIRAETAAFAFGKDLGGSRVTKVSYSLDLQSKTDLNVYFKLASDYHGAVSAKLDGVTVQALRLADGRYRVTIPAIPAHELGTTHSIVFNAGGVCTVSVSALSYVNAALNSDEPAFANDEARAAVASLYRYWQAAAACVGA